jgi:EAL domain-containing protein (putative c-di-GMP-specific phosphodiesterase class I)/DNA-binding NarL/FixJ family response regulator
MAIARRGSNGISLPTAQRRAGVLVLEEDANSAGNLRSALSEDLFNVQWVTTSDQALRLVGATDIVLIAVESSSSDRWSFIEAIRRDEHTRGLGVVVLFSDPALRELAVRSGADRALLHPAAPESLRRVINELLIARNDDWWASEMDTQPRARLRELLYDPTTEIPTIALIIDGLRELIERGQTLNVFCVEIEPLFSLGERNFWDSFDLLRREFVRGLQLTAATLLGNDVIVATSHPGANEFYLFARARKDDQAGALARELESEAQRFLRQVHADPFLIEEVAIFVGGASTPAQPLYAPRILYTAVREAKDIAERRETRYFQALHDRLLRAVRDGSIQTRFQPVLDLRSGEVVGFEALSRGPLGSEIESPDVFFGLARDFQLVWDLETVCIRKVEPMLRDICSGGLLFFNLESNFIQELHERGTDVLQPFLSCENRVVIEVTERSAIRDYRRFRSTLLELKEMGFRIAIDDCGSGYATLEAIAELRPDYLKVGHSLFQNVARDPIRHRLVDLVARLAETIGATTVAEAIETPEQLSVCRDLGIQLGQGYLFARPAPWEEVKGSRKYLLPE